MKKPDKRQICLAGSIVGAVFLAVYELFLKGFYGKEPLSGILDMVITRAVGSVVFIMLLSYLGFKVTDPFRKPFLKSLLITLPCFIVVVCNPPILGLYSGMAHLRFEGDQLAFYMFMFALQCIFVAIFEEFAFRGVVLLSIMEKRRSTNLQIFVSILLSAAVFALVHLVNMITSSPAAVIMQIGYSFLIGGMCAVVLIKTANIWLCVLLHAVFNFCGTLVDTLGAGGWASTPIIIFTVVLGVSVCAYVLVTLFRMDPKETDRIYQIKEK